MPKFEVIYSEDAKYRLEIVADSLEEAEGLVEDILIDTGVDTFRCMDTESSTAIYEITKPTKEKVNG